MLLEILLRKYLNCNNFISSAKNLFNKILQNNKKELKESVVVDMCKEWNLLK